ncbi:MAG: MerR family DNA-binding protein [Candidatus Limnocylindria bacterium]
MRQVLGVGDAGEAPCRVVTDLIDRRYAQVRSRIAELRALERDLARLRARAAQLEPRDCDPSGVCHVIPRQGVDGRGPTISVRRNPPHNGRAPRSGGRARLTQGRGRCLAPAAASARSAP